MSVFVIIIIELKKRYQTFRNLFANSNMQMHIPFKCNDKLIPNPHLNHKKYFPLVAYMKYREICADAIHQRYATTVAP